MGGVVEVVEHLDKAVSPAMEYQSVIGGKPRASRSFVNILEVAVPSLVWGRCWRSHLLRQQGTHREQTEQHFHTSPGTEGKRKLCSTAHVRVGN